MIRESAVMLENIADVHTWPSVLTIRNLAYGEELKELSIKLYNAYKEMAYITSEIILRLEK